LGPGNLQSGGRGGSITEDRTKTIEALRASNSRRKAERAGWPTPVGTKKKQTGQAPHRKTREEILRLERAISVRSPPSAGGRNKDTRDVEAGRDPGPENGSAGEEEGRGKKGSNSAPLRESPTKRRWRRAIFLSK